MTWREALERAIQTLENAGVEDAKLNAEYLVVHALGLKYRSEVRSYLDKEVPSKSEQVFEELIHRRSQREPLQYILGEWEFFGLPIKVGPGVLIPRPETEILVEEALKEAAHNSGPISILDIGTGSGAIALALASRLPHANILGIDSSAEALALAEENRQSLRSDNVRFVQVDLYQSDWPDRTDMLREFNIIVSNPPYVSLEEFEELEPELRLYEPRQALTDESTGLSFYERLAVLAPTLLRPDGRLLVELGHGASEAISGILLRHGFAILRIAEDLARIPRVLVAKLMAE